MLSLDKQKILTGMPPHILKEIKRFEIYDSLGSTNTTVLREFSAAQETGFLCIAEQQTDGRGRLGRAWHSPYQENLYLSYGFKTTIPIAKLSALSLVVGCKLAERLLKLGLNEVGLKWPNDLLLNGRKVSGVLIEVAKYPKLGSQLDQAVVVVGVGLNVNMIHGNQFIEAPSTSILSSVYEQGWTSELKKLAVSYNQQKIICRTQLARMVIIDILEGVFKFLEGGFDQFRDNWKSLDAMEGKLISFCEGEKEVAGLSRGVGLSGEYMIEIDGQVVTLMSGEISLRRKSCSD